MVSQSEIDEIIEWCERRKKETRKVALVEINPFRDKFGWTMRFPTIEIDRPLEVANKHSLVYDSRTKTLWQYLFNQWRKIEPDFEID